MPENADTEIFKRNLAVKLTEPEFVEKATALANIDEEIERVESDRKASNEAFKDEIGGLRSQKKELRTIVRDKVMYKDVDCQWTADWASKSMILRRLDTQEAIDVRAMTEEELQMSMEYPAAEAQGETIAEDRQLPADAEGIDTDGTDA